MQFNYELKQKLMARVRSFAWRAGAFVVVGLISIATDYLADLKLTPELYTLLSLILGEITKYINNEYFLKKTIDDLPV